MSSITTLTDALYGSPPVEGFKPSREGVIKAFAEMGAGVVDLATSFVAGNAYPNRSTMDADLNVEEFTLAVVYDDSNVNNGYYVKIGAVNTGYWANTNIQLPSQFATDIATLTASVAGYVAKLNSTAITAQEAKQYATEAFDEAERAVNIANSVVNQSAAVRQAADNLGKVAELIGDGQGIVVWRNNRFEVANKSEFRGDPGGDATQVGTHEQAKTMNFSASIVKIRTTGRFSDADGGGAEYNRWKVGYEALPSLGQNVWWFQAADGSRWQIADSAMHLAPMFGAMGGDQIDAGPILTVAFQAPMVRTINIGSLVHYFTPRIDIPTGKFLCGMGRSVSRMMVIPISSDQTQSSPRFPIRFLNNDGGGCYDFTLDVQCSGLGRGDAYRTHGISVLALSNGVSRGTRIERVAVYNCTGYAFYTAAEAQSLSRVSDTVHSDCQAYNFQVGFETTGNVDTSYSENTYAYADPVDGSAKIPTEATYHEYGGVKDFKRINPTSRGTVGSAGLLIFTTDGVNVGKITYINPDIDVDAPTGVYVEGRDGYKVTNFEMVGGLVRCTQLGGLFRQCYGIIRDTKITGRNGNGIEAGTGSVLDLYSPELEGNRDPNGSTAAFGISAQGGSIKWFGAGRISAFGPSNSIAVDIPSVTFVGGVPLMTPAQGVTSIAISDKMFVFPRNSWTTDHPGDATNPRKSYWVKVDLSTLRAGGVINRNKTILTVQPLEFPFPNGSVKNPDYDLGVLWIDNTNVRVYIESESNLTGWVLKVGVKETT